MFQVGDVCIYGAVSTTAPWFAKEHNGRECTVVGGSCGKPSCECHVDFGDGISKGVLFSELRKKPPYDGNVKTSWDDLIVWKPRKTEKITYVGNEGVTYTVLYK